MSSVRLLQTVQMSSVRPLQTIQMSSVRLLQPVQMSSVRLLQTVQMSSVRLQQTVQTRVFSLAPYSLDTRLQSGSYKQSRHNYVFSMAPTNSLDIIMFSVWLLQTLYT